jgi:hypothetical protein
MGGFNRPFSSSGQRQPASDEFKPVSHGREDSQSGADDSSGDNAGSNQCHPRKAGVVIRAFVEHVGLAGDTELTVSVKWPASTFSVQPCAKPAAPSSPPPNSQDVPGNGPLAGIGTLYGEAVLDPIPADTPDQSLEKKE